MREKNRVHDPRKVVELPYFGFINVYSDVLVDRKNSRRGKIYKTDLFTVLLFFFQIL